MANDLEALKLILINKHKSPLILFGDTAFDQIHNRICLFFSKTNVATI